MSNVDKFKDAIGADAVLVSDDERVQYQYDASVLSCLDRVEGVHRPFPRVVLCPRNTDEVVRVVSLCNTLRVPLVPFGLGSGVCRGVLPSEESAVISLRALDRVRNIDTANHVGTFEAGVRGSDAESSVNQHGLTIGHWPQSVEISSVGGWVATRSAGQMSTLYGNIEDLVVALEVVLPSGEVLRTKATPRAACGPDLKQLFIGSEGAFGIITAATLSLRHKPASRAVNAFVFSSFGKGVEAVQTIIQSGYRPAVTRVYDRVEVARHFPEIDCGDGASLVLLVHEGPSPLISLESDICQQILSASDGERQPDDTCHKWLKNRNDVPSFEDLLRQGLIFDTVEVGVKWTSVLELYQRIVGKVSKVEGVIAISAHSSHSYEIGTNLYFTFAAQPSQTENRRRIYQQCWKSIMEEVVGLGAGICHHHGIGRLRIPWLEDEIGGEGVALLKTLKRQLDPYEIFNPGVLIPQD